MIFGVNIDDVWSLEKCLPAIRALPKRPTVRVVIDNGVSIWEYDNPIGEIAKTADLMIQVSDSYDEKNLSTAEYVDKARRLMQRFRHLDCLWEVGNEINGDWVTPQMWEKVVETLKVAKDLGLSGKTAITFYLDDSLWPFINSRKFPFFQYALLSCYPANNSDLVGMETSLDGLLVKLKQTTGAIHTGIGEYGEDEWQGVKTTDVICRLINGFEKYNGGFYWNFQRAAGLKNKRPWKAIAENWVKRGGYL